MKRKQNTKNILEINPEELNLTDEFKNKNFIDLVITYNLERLAKFY